MSHTILIVDDEPHMRLLLLETLEDLEDEGVELLEASDGEQALTMIRRHRPDLVLLDVMMPRRNGFEVCTEVKADPELDIKIFLLTAKGQQFDRQRGVEVGADAYMTKPFDPDQVLLAAREVLGL